MSNAGVSADTCLRGDAFCRQPNPSHVPSRAGGRAGTGSAAPRAAHLLVPPAIQGQPKLCACETCWQRPQRSRDSWLGLDQLRRRSGRSQASQRRNIPAHLDRNRKGAPSPPRSNGQAFDEARNPVTVAGRRCILVGSDVALPPAGIRPDGPAPVLYGIRPGPPGLGPGIPIEFPPDGLAGCAQAGAESASAAITATPLKRCFAFICSLR
jgi:hypothetical protein